MCVYIYEKNYKELKMFCKQFNLKRIIRIAIALFLFTVLLISSQSLFAKEDVSENVIYFYPDTDIIKERSNDTLKNLALMLKNNKDLKVKLDGFTNSLGLTDAELELSKKRALKIASYLIKEGIKEDRIFTEGFGSNYLVVDEISEINRRVKINIIKPAVQSNAAQVENKNVEIGYRRVIIEIYDADNHALVADLEVKKKIDDDLELLRSARVNKSIALDVPNNEKIELLVSTDGYMPKKVDLDTSENYKKIILEKIEIGRAYSFDNIYFNSLKSSIKRESYDIINKIINVLNENPKMKVKIIGHTQAPCQKLSNDRALSVVDYCKRRRVSGNRLVAEGYSNKALKEAVVKNERIKNNMRVEFVFFE